MKLKCAMSLIDGLACSGGPDSMGALEFLLRGRHRPTILHFNHGTEHGRDAQAFIVDYCIDNGLNLELSSIRGSKPKDKSWEEWWRDERYNFLHSFNGTVATAHNLNDVAETWLMGAIHGRTRLIPYRRANVIRPWLKVPAASLRTLAKVYVDDPGNEDMKYDRVKIRSIMDTIYSVNPGYLKVIAKKL